MSHPTVAPLLGTDLDVTRYSVLWNFSPLYAVCLFGAAHLSHRRWAYAVPLGAWLASDFGIWALTGRADWAFYGWGQLFVYASVALMVTIGLPLRRHRSAWAVGGAGLAAAIQFYLITNFAVWAFGTTYPHTGSGLLACYVAGLPFLRNMLISLAVFLPVLFIPAALGNREPATEHRAGAALLAD